MRRRRMAVQEDLFPPDGPAISLAPEHREDLIGLVGALILEVMTHPDTAEGGEHGSGHR